MPNDPQPPSLPGLIRYWLGTDRIEILEATVATAAEQLADLSVRFDDFTSDVRAALATLVADRANLTPEGQTALDALSAKLAAADAEVGDADGSDNPPA